MDTVMQGTLEGAQVVIVGGSSGLGLAAAAAAKARGAEVTLVGRTPAKLDVAATRIGGARTAVADIADRNSVEAVFGNLARVDHLVITAGGLQLGRLAESDPDWLLEEVQQRIAGPLYAIKAALPLMPPTGSIVLTGGQFSDRPPGNGESVIAAAVRGVEALARSLALELRPIRVNVIAPGLIDTPLFDVFGPEGRASVFRETAQKLPVGRTGRPEEVGEGIAFLLGNGYMNGEVLHIDGGGRLV
ncbi:SDR family oxidoreductase [Gallaecimonas kandeliae]|uniref:SDR family oxidoreductase n=1 Tax=Gallaecimonas kandeliae TaxID=3029055 RepID=UPI002648EC9D|nr:SDR family oxidoreductase [Gallaecimonas kandeliae]WKE65626.1 SDR family oxidoreductase [Gallaecimonas kandeliae]